MAVASSRMKVLLVEPDPRVVEIVVESLTTRFGAHVTCVAIGRDALDAEMLEPHHVAVAELCPPDMDGLDLAEQLLSLSPRPVILMGTAPSAESAIAALRLGVRDLFIKPFPVKHLLKAVESAVASRNLHVHHQSRYRRHRELFRQVLRERRELKQRLELICKDLVQAHHRLVTRVLEIEHTVTGQA